MLTLTASTTRELGNKLLGIGVYHNMSPAARWIKRLAWTSVVTGSLGIILAVAIYAYGGLPLIIKLVNRSVSAPTAEEYAVYSDFIDSLFSSDQPFRMDLQIDPNSTVYIEDTTSYLENFRPLPPLLGVDAFGPGQDYHQQDATPWRLQPRFHPHMKWALVRPRAIDFATSLKTWMRAAEKDPSKALPYPKPSGPFPENPEVCGVLQLSRVGLDWHRRTATLAYTFMCGALCGQTGNDVLLQKIGKHWQVTSWGTGAVY